MKSRFRTRYRIVRDRYSGFEAQFLPWWWPFWLQCFGSNTKGTVEAAREVCCKHSKAFVEYFEPEKPQ